MKSFALTTLPGALAAALLVLPARADKIYRTNGKVIEGITIVQETLAQVIYKKGSNQQGVPSEEVLRVEFEKKPRLVDEADLAMEDDDPIGALDIFDTYVDGQIRKSNERRKWAPPYAAWRTVEIRTSLADLSGVVRSAARLIENFPDSRYLPMTHLAKAYAQSLAGRGGAAQATLKELLSLVESKSLSKRWELEARLGLIVTDSSKKGDDKRDALAEIIGEAGSQFPTVKSRAQVAEGEAYLQDAEAGGRSDAQRIEAAEKARSVFEDITKAQRADDETLAGAYTGLGSALYKLGVFKKDMDLIEQATLYFLRVDILYRDQTRYVPAALFWAMRGFDVLNQKDRYRDVKRALTRRYPGSNWATEAEKY